MVVKPKVVLQNIIIKSECFIFFMLLNYDPMVKLSGFVCLLLDMIDLFELVEHFLKIICLLYKD